MELDAMRKGRLIRRHLGMKCVKSLIWPVIKYGTVGFKTDDERKIEAVMLPRNAANTLDGAKNRHERTGLT